MNVAAKMEEVDAMSGPQFEEFIAAVLRTRGFTATAIGGSNDKGVDIVAERDGIRYAIQCKRHTAKLSRSAVSDCVAGMALHRCKRSMVVASSGFHEGAVQLAAANDCVLVGRGEIIEWVTESDIAIERYADWSAAVAVGPIEVRILSAELLPPNFDETRDPDASADGPLQLFVRVQLRNDSDVKKFTFNSWGEPNAHLYRYPAMRELAVRSGQTIVSLSDNFDNEYQLLGTRPEHAAQQSLYPRKTVYDLLVFEPPVTRMEHLNLQLPCQNFDFTCKRTLRLRIPAAAIVSPRA